LDFKDVVQRSTPTEIVDAINQMVVLFDQCTERYDVFKVDSKKQFNKKTNLFFQVETKADSSYMIVSGIQERSVQRRKSSSVDKLQPIKS